jgi:hypothetical protein
VYRSKKTELYEKEEPTEDELNEKKRKQDRERFQPLTTGWKTFVLTRTKSFFTLKLNAKRKY